MRDEFITGAHLTAASPYLLDWIARLEAERDQIRTDLREVQTKLAKVALDKSHARLKR
jgi:hypothetical protein